MKACGFDKRTYTPEKDSEVDNVRVEATRPTGMATMGHAPASAGYRAEALNMPLVGLFSSLLGFAIAM